MLIFVHGMGSNANVWDPIINYFNERDFSCKAINLREGLNLKKVHFQDYVEKVKAIASEEDIVIGHSMGGLIVQKVAEEANIKCGIAICSATPKGLRYHRNIILASAKFAPKVIRGRPFKQDYGYVRKYALVGLDEKKAKSAYNEIENDSSIVVFELGMKRIAVDENKVKCPLLFIGTKQDGICTPDLAKRLAEKYNAEYRIYDGCHNFFYNDSWQKIAEEIHSFIKQNI